MNEKVAGFGDVMVSLTENELYETFGFFVLLLTWQKGFRWMTSKYFETPYATVMNPFIREMDVLLGSQWFSLEKQKLIIGDRNLQT